LSGQDDLAELSSVWIIYNCQTKEGILAVNWDSGVDELGIAKMLFHMLSIDED
jgi:hypothetical protein